MARCQYCKKLTHSEHVNIYFDEKDYEKIVELFNLQDWKPLYQYVTPDTNRKEVGKIKLGDIVLHFIPLNGLIRDERL